MIFEVLDAADKRLRREKNFVGIIIHHTDVGGRKEISQSLWSKISDNITSYLAAKDTNYVSSHFVIKRNGIVVRLVNPDYYEAWHAGKSSYWHPVKRRVVEDWNRYAIGIELVGDGNLHKFSDEQYASLISLTKYLTDRYQTIHPLCITSHEMISPGRKIDPGYLFDWARLFKGLYGS